MSTPSPQQEATTSDFPPIEQRLKSGHVTAWVASDTIEALANHIAAIVQGTDGKRRMTLVSRYRPNTDPQGDEPYEDRGLAGTRVQCGLTLEDPQRIHPDPIEHRTQERPAGRSLTVHLQPGIHAFGISAYESDGTEDEKRARYWAYDPKDIYSTRTDITKVTIDGWPGSPSRADTIAIERWNQHGVCEDTLIVFDDIWDDED